MGNLREKLGLKKPKVVRLPEPIPPPPSKPGKPPVVGIEWVKATCGHPVAFERFDDSKDKYRDQRRLKVTGRICQACRQAEQEKVMAEARERRRLKKAKWDEKQGEKYRLPDQSVFHSQYDEVTTTWEGTLTVKVEGGDIVFTSTKSGVFGLMRDLDRQFRAWLHHQEATQGQEAGG